MGAGGPRAVEARGVRGRATFHPAFAYEALWSAATVALLLVLERGGVLSRGRLRAAYAVAYGTGWFLLELIRTDTTFRLVGVSRNGWIALALLVAGTAGLIASRRRPHAAAQTTQRPFSAAPVRAPEEVTLDVLSRQPACARRLLTVS